MSETRIVTLTETDLTAMLNQAIEQGVTRALRLFSNEQRKDELLTPTECAKYLKCTKPMLYRYEQQGLLHPHRNGRKVLYSLKEIEQWEK